MQVKVSSTEYDLSNEAQVNILFNKISGYKQRTLQLILKQVSPYQSYNGDDIRYVRAKELFSLVTQKLDEHTASMVTKQQADYSASLLSAPAYKNTGFYLLNPIHSTAKYIIGTPALNTSGDIYHVVSYLAVAKKFGFDLPDALIVYDNQTTQVHANRAANFARLIGFNNVYTIKQSQQNSTQANVRTAGLREKVSQSPFPSYLIDQKMTTMLLAEFYQRGDNSVSFLKTALLDQAMTCAATFRPDMNEWIEQEFTKINAAAQGRPILLFNHRKTHGANDQQDLTQNGLDKIQSIVAEENIFLWYLCANGDKTNPLEKQFNETFLFENTVGHSKELDENGFYKLRHLLLLAKLSQLPHLVGVAGNTSGTLDIAAFLGLRTYSFHTFGSPPANLYLKAQDYRILLQHSFLSIGLPLIPSGADAPSDNHGSLFRSWLQSKNQTNTFPPLPGRTIGIVKREGIHYQTHAERLPYAGTLTWPIGDVNPRELGHPLNKITTNPVFVSNSIFDTHDQQLRKKVEQFSAIEEKSADEIYAAPQVSALGFFGNKPAIPANIAQNPQSTPSLSEV